MVLGYRLADVVIVLLMLSSYFCCCHRLSGVFVLSLFVYGQSIPVPTSQKAARPVKFWCCGGVLSAPPTLS